MAKAKPQPLPTAGSGRVALWTGQSRCKDFILFYPSMESQPRKLKAEFARFTTNRWIRATATEHNEGASAGIPGHGASQRGDPGAR